MSVWDVLRTSFLNLWRRKLRAFLTVLGMVIGTTSIVVMVSLGIGIREATIQSFAQTGSLTTITVDRWKQVESKASDGSAFVSYEENEVQLNDKSVESFRGIPGVKAVMPMMQMYGILKSGRYISDAQILGVEPGVANEFEIALSEGELPTDIGRIKYELALGAYTLNGFVNPDNYKQAVDSEGNPKITLDSRMQLTFDYSQIYDWAQPEEDSKTPPGKFYTIVPTGVVSSESNNYAWYCLMDIAAFKRLAKENRAFVGDNIDNYYQVLVKCVSLDDVAAVKTQISDMGYGTYSMLDAVEMAQESTQRVQILLGAIGGVSLLVAAIGIMNTMMMSIYERTREIGIIKVLGCRMGNIASLFLTESAYIGLFGGAIGLLLSYALSFVLNRFLVGYGLTSIIPVEVAVGAVAFSVAVAMLSGLYPSIRAMRLSPLAAIRNE